jgi:hypothetical protein
VPVTAYNGGEAAIDRERFINARAEDIKIEWKDDVASDGCRHLTGPTHWRW